MSDKVHIVLASDANYLPGLEVTRASILRSCKTPERIVWHVFGEKDLAQLDVSAFEAWNCGSKMTYLRLFLPELLPEVDRIVYSDVDVIWERDICELWERTRDDGPSVWWVRDFRSTATHDGYGCAGVCVMNLMKLRAFGLSRKSLEYVREHGTPPFVDQGLLNILLRNDADLLPVVWNVMGDCLNLPPDGEPSVYHLTGIGRHFHDATPPVYPPQYLFWWCVREDLKKKDGTRVVVPRGYRMAYRALMWLWPLHLLANVLPMRLRERVVRQWFFARLWALRFGGK